MTEEEAIFDLSLKKKKKKKKTPFDFDAAIADGAAASEPSTGDLKKKSFPVEDSEVTVAEIEKQDGEDGVFSLTILEIVSHVFCNGYI